jgi:hypothetical protein
MDSNRISNKERNRKLKKVIRKSNKIIRKSNKIIRKSNKIIRKSNKIIREVKVNNKKIDEIIRKLMRRSEN